VAVAGCSSAPTVYPCPALAINGPQVLYPIPGATGVSTAAGSIVVTGFLPSSDVVDLTAGGATKDLGPLGPPPSPLPSPEATPQYEPTAPATPRLLAVAYPKLAPATTYTIGYHDTSTICPISPGGGGTFTTQ